MAGFDNPFAADKWNTPAEWKAENASFEVGACVVIPADVWVDFRPWKAGTTGTVVRNSGAYLGIIVRFDVPRRERDNLTGAVYELTEYNFNGRHLARLED